MSEMTLDQLRKAMLRLTGAFNSFEGGYNGSCYECPFASVPLRWDGSEAAWSEIDNDPTEAYYRCSLPGRDNASVVWGEYAPCTSEEWVDGCFTQFQQTPPPTEKAP